MCYFQMAVAKISELNKEKREEKYVYNVDKIPELKMRREKESVFIMQTTFSASKFILWI